MLPMPAFFEEELGVRIAFETGTAGVAVAAGTVDGTVTTVVEGPGDALRHEVEEAVENADLAARYALEDVEGVGPTYASRLILSAISP